MAKVLIEITFDSAEEAEQFVHEFTRMAYPFSVGLLVPDEIVSVTVTP